MRGYLTPQLQIQGARSDHRFRRKRKHCCVTCRAQSPIQYWTEDFSKAPPRVWNTQRPTWPVYAAFHTGPARHTLLPTSMDALRTCRMLHQAGGKERPWAGQAASTSSQVWHAVTCVIYRHLGNCHATAAGLESLQNQCKFIGSLVFLSTEQSRLENSWQLYRDRNHREHCFWSQQS